MIHGLYEPFYLAFECELRGPKSLKGAVLMCHTACRTRRARFSLLGEMDVLRTALHVAHGYRGHVLLAADSKVERVLLEASKSAFGSVQRCGAERSHAVLSAKMADTHQVYSRVFGVLVHLLFWGAGGGAGASFARLTAGCYEACSLGCWSSCCCGCCLRRPGAIWGAACLRCWSRCGRIFVRFMGRVLGACSLGCRFGVLFAGDAAGALWRDWRPGCLGCCLGCCWDGTGAFLRY